MTDQAYLQKINGNPGFVDGATIPPFASKAALDASGSGWEIGTIANAAGVSYSWGGAGVGWHSIYGTPAWQVIGPTGRLKPMASPTVKTAVDTRKAHTTEIPVSVIRLMYRNASCDGTTFGEITNLSALGTQTVNATIEYGSAYVPVLFNGQKTCTIPAGGVVISDPIFLGPIPAGGVFFSRTHATIAGGLGFAGSDGGYRGYEGVAYNGSDISAGTGISGYTATTGDIQLAPFAVLARTGAGSTLFVGDSITYGVGDTGLIQDPLPPVFSWTRRCAAGKFPCYVAGYPGGYAEQFADFAKTPTLHVDLSQLAFSRGVLSFGANDCLTSTTAQVKAAIKSSIAKMRSLGIPRIYVSLVLPRTASTDSWATIENQTPSTGFAVGGVRDQVNEWIRGLCDGLADGVIDTCTGVAIGAAWLPGKTSDGAHPTTGAHATIAANASASLP